MGLNFLGKSPAQRAFSGPFRSPAAHLESMNKTYSTQPLPMLFRSAEGLASLVRTAVVPVPSAS
jgi:hypothetical protein